MANLTSSLTLKLVDDVTKPARTVAQALEQAEKQAKSIAKAMSGDVAGTSRFTANLGKLGLAAKDVEKVAGAWKDYARSAGLAGKASDWTRAQANDVRRWESQTIAALRAVQREEKAFASAQKAAMAQSHGKAGHGPSQWGHGGALGFAAQGAAAAVSAHEVYSLSKEAVMAGAELQHERVASMNAGRTAGELKEFEEAAKRVGKARPTASYTESMKTLLETTSAFGSTEHAIEHLDFMMKTAAVLKASSGGKISDSAGEMGQKFAKFFEMRGVAGDAKRFEREGNEMTRAMTFSGGTFNPHEMFLYATQAKAALRGYSQEYISRYMPSIVGTMGGEKAGSAAMAGFNTIMGKARDKKQLEEWQKYGLLDSKMLIRGAGKNGAAIGWRAGAVKGTDIAMRNPLEWFETVVLPAMKKKGVDVDNSEELTKVLATMFRNQNANVWANEHAQAADRARLHKDKGLIDQTSSPDEMYKRNLAEDPTQSITAVAASLNSLAAAATQPGMQAAAGMLSSIAGGLMTLAAAAKDHPMTAMTTAGVTAAGGMAGAGYLSYQFMSGFGLREAATELTAAAGALTGAAEKQALGGAAGAAESALGVGGKLLRAVPLVGGAVIAGGIAADGLKAYKDANPTLFRGGARAGAAYRMYDVQRAEAAGPQPRGHWEEAIPAGRGRAATPRHWVEEIEAGAAQAKTALDGIKETTVAPTADTSGLDGILSKVGAIRAALASLNGEIAGAGAAASRLKIPSIGAVQRSDFTAGDPGR